MKGRLFGITILFVFIFGLIPGDYWIPLHPHKHGKINHSSGITLSGTQRICVSQTHLYDYTKNLHFVNIVEISIIQIVSFPTEKHVPHSSFLNKLLRAPPVS